MKRLLLENLVKWKKSLTKKPLILKGVRQVGKTIFNKKVCKRILRGFD